MAVKAEELTGLNANVDDVIYMPSLQAPDDRPHPFVYFITISNQSEEAVTIRGRKWIISDSETTQKTVVEGEGVATQTPHLAPGEDFSYNSFHMIKSDSTASGAVFATTDDGRVVYARIPDFDMHVPQWA